MIDISDSVIEQITRIANIAGKEAHPNVQIKPKYEEYQVRDIILALTVFNKIVAVKEK